MKNLSSEKKNREITTVLHCIALDNFNFTRKKNQKLCQKKFRENPTVLHWLTVDNFDFTKKLLCAYFFGSGCTFNFLSLFRYRRGLEEFHIHAPAPESPQSVKSRFLKHNPVKLFFVRFPTDLLAPFYMF